MDGLGKCFYVFVCLTRTHNPVLSVHPRLAEEYKEQSWAAMSELEKELQQIEAQYGEEFGDASESEEEELDMETREEGGGQ